MALVISCATVFRNETASLTMNKQTK